MKMTTKIITCGMKVRWFMNSIALDLLSRAPFLRYPNY
uniref:Uncharacterized protein n=1 Tax=Rhizophora mucronata TaxID=61149 RepID=A0A2P2QIG0_RHIMU